MSHVAKDVANCNTSVRDAESRVALIFNILILAIAALLATSIPANAQITTWGNNSSGQLGRPIPPSNLNPTTVLTLGSGTMTVAAGSSHTLALKSDGSLVAWGSNSNGQLGDGTTLTKLAPTPVSGFGAGSVVTSIAAGNNFSLAVKDGSVYSWGVNSNGQLGDGTMNPRSTPGLIGSLGNNVIAVSAGSSFSLALKNDGSVWAWGQNSNGQLGNGNNTQQLSPVPVSGLGALSGVDQIAAGSSHSLARKTDGTVLAWGSNANGEIGDNSLISKNVPTPVSSLTGVEAIAAGITFSLARKSDLTMWSWGSNSSGQLGDPATGNARAVPGPVLPPSGPGVLGPVISISAGSTFSLAVKSDGTVLAWGSNSSGQLGISGITFSQLPIQVTGLGTGSGVDKVFAAGSHSIALKNDGSVLAWGSNSSGQLGRGTFDGTPLPIDNVTGIADIATGSAGSHNLARKSDGTVLAWGSNGLGQVGDGTNSQKNAPVNVRDVGGAPNSTLSGVMAVAAGAAHSLALKSTGAVVAWGSNSDGQLGTNNLNNSNIPLQVLNLLTGAKAIAAGTSFSLALKTDGTVVAWGINGNGQLGDGTLLRKLTPVAVSGLTTVKGIAAGQSHGLALKEDGTVWAWGLNTNGQLGDNSNTQRTTPVQVRDASDPSGFLTNIIAIAAGGSSSPLGSHSLAVRNDGKVYAWGLNSSGQLGDGTAANKNVATPVSGLGVGSGVVMVAAGTAHSLAKKLDGSVFAWGLNSSGQLGDGTFENRLTPVPTAVTGAGSIGAGGTHSLAVAGVTDSTPPVITFNITGLGSSGWYRTDVTVTWSAVDPDSGIVSPPCGTTTLTAETTVAGTTVTCSATNGAGMTVSVPVTIKIDKTPPSASANASPAPNAAGWNNTDVTATFTGSDSLSGLDSCSPLVTLNTDGVGQSASGTCADLAGNVSLPAAVSGIKIDKTKPTASGTPSPLPNANGWNNSDVTVTFAGSDNLSGIASCSSVIINTEGSNNSASGTCTDVAGNVSVTATVSPIKIDKTKPTASGAPSPLPNAAGWNNSDVTVTFTGSDSLSGIDTCSSVIINTEGSNNSASGTCTDLAGNVSVTATVSPIKIDKTKPTASGTPSPLPNAAGWNNSDVTVTFTGSDSLSGIDSCSSVTVSTEGSNQSASGTCTDIAGNVSVTATVSPIKIDKTKPTASGTPSPLPNAAGWNNSDVTVTFTGSDSLSGPGTCSAPVTLSTEGSSNSASGSCTDLAGNVSVTATVSPIKIDKTKPTASGTPSPLPNAAGWNNSDVTVTFTGSDSLSGIDSCSSVTINTEGSNQSATGTCTDFAGNISVVATVSPIKIDKTKPTASGTPSPLPNAAGWNNSDVTVTFTASDSLSGPGTCSAPVTLSTEGSSNSASGTCTDLAGNVSVTATVSPIKIDKTKPTASGTPSPLPNAAGWNNTDVTVTFTGSDSLSGPGTCSAPVTLSTEGSSNSASGTCTDLAGNVSVSATVGPIKIDKTKPTASGTPSPLPNAAGWNNTDVTVTFTGSDSLSGPGTCSAPVTLSTEGSSNSASGTCTDLAGNVSVTTTVGPIKIDKTKPTTSGTPSPLPNAAGWNNTDVTVTFTGSDSLSGPVTCSAPVTLSTEGSNLSASGTCADLAGNVSPATVSGIKIDKTKPTASATATPPPDQNGWNSTPVTVTFTGTDNLSTVASCTPPQTFSTNGANQTASGTCTDFAGNVSAVVTIRVNINLNTDTDPPVISGMPANGCMVWPVDRRLHQVASITASDSSGIKPGSFLVAVTVNEEVKPGDIVINGGAVQVRADRDANGKGRIYTIRAQAEDLAGNRAKAEASCTVPHDARDAH